MHGNKSAEVRPKCSPRVEALASQAQDTRVECITRSREIGEGEIREVREVREVGDVSQRSQVRSGKPCLRSDLKM